MKVLINLFIICGVLSCVYVSSKGDDLSDDTALVGKSIDRAKNFESDTSAQVQIAYGSLKFGSTPEENRKVYKNYFQDFLDSNYTCSVYYNSEKKLYMVAIESISKMGDNNNNQAKNQMQNLVDTITKKYGHPDSTYTYPNFSSLRPEYIHWTNIWTIATKKIKIGITKVSGEQYKAICWIYDEPMFDKVQEENANETKKKQKK